MPSINYVVDICSNSNSEELDKLINASKAYWTGQSKNYVFVMNSLDNYDIRIFKGKIENDEFSPGTTVHPRDQEAVLLYVKTIED